MFKRIVLAVALLIAACAAYFSVTGIGQLFLGAIIPAMIMAAALEMGKLVLVSFVYRYWTQITKPLRIYYTFATVVLMAITSLGVYGYLSSAYARSASAIAPAQAQLAAITSQQRSLTETAARASAQLTQATATLQQQERRLDQLVGKSGFITQQKTVQQQNTQVIALQQQVTRAGVERDSLEFLKGTVQTTMTGSSKIGTFYYVASMFGVSLDTIVRWFILSIVLVFDPLSITLLVAYNIMSDAPRPVAQTEQLPILPVVPRDDDEPLAPDAEPLSLVDIPLDDSPPPVDAVQIDKRLHGVRPFN